MTKIMERVVDEGSLYSGAGWGSKFTFRDERGSYRLPVAGKTGTTQNWSDAWAIGYSPYYTTAVWFGFDKPGNSLGVELTGATLAGPVWGDYFREIHRGLPRRSFTRPASGIMDVTVCAKSGLLRTENCNEGAVTLTFLEGTQPAQYCDLHGGSAPYRTPVSINLFGGLGNSFLDSLPMPQLQLDLLPELQNSLQQQRQPAQTQPNRNNNNRNQPVVSANPFLDDIPPPVNNPPETELVTLPDNIILFNQEKEEKEENEFDLPSWNPLM
jgi:penicillin-binding protein 1A